VRATSQRVLDVVDSESQGRIQAEPSSILIGFISFMLRHFFVKTFLKNRCLLGCCSSVVTSFNLTLPNPRTLATSPTTCSHGRMDFCLQQFWKMTIV
jgi:hypothetical protein